MRPTSLTVSVSMALSLLCLGVCAEAQQSSGQRGGARQVHSLKQATDAFVLKEMKRQQAVGAAVGIIRGRQIIYLKAYGFEDRDKNIACSRQTLFRWASISKPVTAVAAMQLWDRGQLKLNQDIRELIPEFPQKPQSISMRQLLCHQGGIVHYRNGKVIRSRRKYHSKHPFKSVILALDRFKESPLLFKPGEKFSYTTHGFILASAVVERAAGKEFWPFVRKNIAQPLKMKTFQPDYQWLKLPHRAVGYRRVGDSVIKSSDTDVSWKLGGGGFISNIDDLAAFGLGLIKGQLVSPKAEALMWTRQKTSAGKRTGYGLGFGVSGKGRSLLVSHSGGQEKTRTLLMIRPKKGLGVVFMTNSEHVRVGRFVKPLLAMVEEFSKHKRLY